MPKHLFFAMKRTIYSLMFKAGLSFALSGLYNRRQMLRVWTRLTLSFVTCALFVMAAMAQEITLSQAMVPVIGSAVGLGDTVWQCDIAVYNTHPYDVEIAFTLPGVPNDPFFFTTVAAGRSLTFPDIARQTFGVVDRLSPMRVTTIGATSVIVAAVVHGVTEHGTTDPEVLTVQYGEFRPMLDTLTGLVVNDTFRTNIGLANPTDKEAIVVLALQKVPGRNLAVVSESLPPLSFVQVPLQQIFPLLTEAENLSLVVEHTNPQAYVYASVIANATGNARYQGPR